MKQIPSLFEWLGGETVLNKLMVDFYDKVLKDELLKPIFDHMSDEHRLHVGHFIGEVFKGPKSYTQQDGGSHASMVAHHLGKMLTENQRRRWMDLLLETADQNGLPSDPEFRSAFIAYLEWGSRIAVVNSHSTINPLDDHDPMPSWGWGEPGGPYILEKQ
jgi:hemoglobin